MRVLQKNLYHIPTVASTRGFLTTPFPTNLHSKEVLHRPMDQTVGINHSDKVAPPQVPPIYTKMVEIVLNTTVCHL
jgi:hypothetical protein